VRDSKPDVLGAEVGAGGAELAQILPELRELLPGLSEPVPLDPDGARFRLFDATATFLRNAAARRPIMLVLDDLHAADTPSLLLLRYVARELASMRILLVGAFRDVDPVPGRPLSEMLAEVSREPVTRRVALGGLSGQDVADYIEQAAAGLASPELAAALHEQTEGNPLFLAEIVRLLALEGPGAAPAIPESVREVIRRRLDHLSEACNRLLVLAAVLGREFALDALTRIADLSADELLDTLDEAMLARVVLEVPGASGRLRFAHILIRDTLYDDLTTARRVRFHRLVVGALEGLYGDDPGPHLAELAHHAIAASEFEKALLCAQRAAERALELLAYEEAERLNRVALEALDLARPNDELTRCELLLALAEAQIRAGDTPAAKEGFAAAAAIARRLRLANHLARAAAGYGGRIVWVRAGDDERLVPLLEEALAALGNADVQMRVRLLARLAGALRDDPTRDRREALSSEAVELARASGDHAALAYALDAYAYATLAPDTVGRWLLVADEMRRAAEHVGDKERVVASHMLAHMAHFVLGDIRDSEAELERASRLAVELRQGAQLCQVRGDQAMVALAQGRLADGERLTAETFELGQQALPEAILAVSRCQRYTLQDFRGELAEVEPEIAELVVLFPARTVFRAVHAHVHARLGRHDEARHALAELKQRLPFDQEWLFGASLLAETAATVGDVDAARTLYPALSPWRDLNAADVAEGCRGAVSRYLGLLAATLGRRDEAATHFEHALAMNKHMGFRPWLAHTQHDYARMLLARSTALDREHGRKLLDQARATYRELGMRQPSL
jgi:tetratricopeptide (TPR) repeat protein